jgi:hypothetical protein
LLNIKIVYFRSLLIGASNAAQINENEGGCQTLVSAPLPNTSMTGNSGHLPSTTLHDPNHFHSSSSAPIAQVANHYSRSQHSLNHHHHQQQHQQHESIPNANLVNGFLNNLLPTDPLPVRSSSIVGPRLIMILLAN